jgi:beta-galactosidase GanA
MLAGELHNSSLSDPAYMSTVWPNMRAANINTLLGSVTWEMIEPVEGHFTFSSLDKIILDTRKFDMKLVLLWFGSFKNALSTYAPGWVKRDIKRFPRVHTLEAGGVRKTLELVSPFCEEGWRADGRAFAALMRHLKEFDGVHSTVIMVQVENETGLLGDSRDRSRIANEKFKQPVPKYLMDNLQSQYDSEVHSLFRKRFPNFKTLKAGVATWQEAFGKSVDADEMFMADAFSRYVGRVAAAGKAEYPIPLYTNVWLNFDDPTVLDLQGLPVVVGGGAQAGVYPSGGAVAHTMDVWKMNAPALDFIAPDLYFHDYEEVCKQYRHRDQPLFIPEQRRDERGARRVWLAYGTYLSIGTSPFGIDSLEAKDSPITKHYGLLSSVSEFVLETQANRPEDIMGFFFDELSETKVERTWVQRFGEFELTIGRAFVFGKAGPGAGMVIHQGGGKFLLIGWGFQVTFKSMNPKSTFTGILYSEEKTVSADGKLQTARVMNGDETRSGSFYIMPNEDPDYGGFPIAVTIPSRTMIAECTAYSVEEEENDF